MKASHQSTCNSCYVTCIIIQIILTLTGMQPCLCQQITISNSSVDVQSLCPGDMITLTCETRGSLLIAWRSIDYVSRIAGNQLEFDDFDTIGNPKRSSVYNTTFAELTSVSRVPPDNTLVLVSQLHITIRSDVNSSTVMCVDENGNPNTITLRLLDTPGKVEIISDQREDRTAGGCVVHYSWIPPSNININNISHFTVTFNGSNEVVNKIEETALYMKAQPVCTCAAHNISIVAIDQCRRVGPSRAIIAQSLSGATCNDASIVDPSPATNMHICNKTGLKAAVGVLSVLFGVSVILLIVLAAVILKFREEICGGNDKKLSSRAATPEKEQNHQSVDPQK